jgi:hypothetical protein
MITKSSNLATNLLIDRLGVESIQATVERLGGAGMVVRRKLEDGKAYARGLNNTTTARGLAALMEALATGRAVSPAASRDMVEILKRQYFRDGIPAGLPSGTVVANKTGGISTVNHDAAIVYGPRPYVLVVLVRGRDEQTRVPVIAEVARMVNEAALRLRPGPSVPHPQRVAHEGHPAEAFEDGPNRVDHARHPLGLARGDHVGVAQCAHEVVGRAPAASAAAAHVPDDGVP